jgi:hypothetical protein
MAWQVPAPGMTMAQWQAGRCAGCGIEGETLVRDHNHQTGLERGLLCRSCNTAEGQSRSGRWARWRSGWNPATLLGIEEIYEGWETSAYRAWLQATEPTMDELREAINKLGTTSEP